MTCDDCGGDGKCVYCKGSGTCSECDGTGTVENDCPHCGNFGVVPCDTCAQFASEEGKCTECYDADGICPPCEGLGIIDPC